MMIIPKTQRQFVLSSTTYKFLPISFGGNPIAGTKKWGESITITYYYHRDLHPPGKHQKVEKSDFSYVFGRGDGASNQLSFLGPSGYSPNHAYLKRRLPHLWHSGITQIVTSSWWTGNSSDSQMWDLHPHTLPKPLPEVCLVLWYMDWGIPKHEISRVNCLESRDLSNKMSSQVPQFLRKSCCDATENTLRKEGLVLSCSTPWSVPIFYESKTQNPAIIMLQGAQSYAADGWKIALV